MLPQCRGKNRRSGYPLESLHGFKVGGKSVTRRSDLDSFHFDIKKPPERQLLALTNQSRHGSNHLEAARIAEGKIQSISLARTPFTDAQLSYLKALPHLERLNLEATDVSDAGLESLSKLATLRDLNLNFTSVSDRGFASLAEPDAIFMMFVKGVHGTLLRGQIPGA
jgi:hypothetical protein